MSFDGACRKMTDESVALAAVRYNQGASLAVVANEFGVHQRTLARELRPASRFDVGGVAPLIGATAWVFFPKGIRVRTPGAGTGCGHRRMLGSWSPNRGYGERATPRVSALRNFGAPCS